ncbi:hypothetical protein ACFL2T_03880 [Elusimicrobiota bacterium]
MEAAALAGVAGMLLWYFMERHLLGPALLGLTFAWMVSCVSLVTLLYGQAASFGAFVGAFGGGVAMRVFVFGGLMVAVWGQSRGVQSAIGVTYIVSAMFFVTIEYRHLRLT